MSRAESRATDLVDHFRGINQAKLSALSLNDSSLPRILQSSDIIINATPAGMVPNVNEMPAKDLRFRKGQFVLDLIYRPMKTQMLRRAEEDGARAISGLEMFLHQGAEAFKIWTDQDMDLKKVRAAILGKLEQDSNSSTKYANPPHAYVAKLHILTPEQLLNRTYEKFACTRSSAKYSGCHQVDAGRDDPRPSQRDVQNPWRPEPVEDRHGSDKRRTLRIRPGAGVIHQRISSVASAADFANAAPRSTAQRRQTRLLHP